MKTRMRLLAILFVMGLVAGSAWADLSCKITLTSASKIRGVEFKPGEYKVVIDAAKVRLTHVNSGKTVELEAKVLEADSKYEHTSVHTQDVAGARQIIEIRIAGSKTSVSFN